MEGQRAVEEVLVLEKSQGVPLEKIRHEIKIYFTDQFITLSK